MESKFTGTPIQCAKCEDVIFSHYSGEFVTCKCGAISVDQTPYYSRWVGDLKYFTYFEELTKEQDNDIL